MWQVADRDGAEVDVPGADHGAPAFPLLPKRAESRNEL